MPDSCHAFYQSDFQSLYALWVAPALFLGWLLFRETRRRGGAEPAAAGFLRVYSLVFAVETMVDPFVSGLLVRWLDAGEHATAFMLPFVLLGDFRVFLLVFFVAEPGLGVRSAAARAAFWTLIVPVLASAVYAAIGGTSGAVPSQVLWLVYEAAFTGLALYLLLSWVGQHVAPDRLAVRRYLRAALGYVALYYSLWAAADAVILAGSDAGWALRVLPNQLYYGFWLPVAYGLFFRSSGDVRDR